MERLALLLILFTFEKEKTFYPVFMKESKAFLIIKTFSEEEKEQLYLFIDSPYAKIKEDVARLLALYCEQAFLPETDQKALSDEQEFAYLFPNTPLHKGRIATIRSQALQALMRFLMYENIEKNEFDSRYPLLDYFIERKLGRFYESLQKELSESMQTQATRANKKWVQYIQMKESYFGYELVEMPQKPNSYTQELTQYLERFYYIKKLEYLLFDYHNLNKFDTDIKTNILYQVEDILQTPPSFLEEDPALEMYYLLLKMFHHKDEATYEKALSFIAKHEETFAIEDTRNFYGYIRSFCVAKMNQGVIVFEDHLLDLYVLLLKKPHFLFANGTMVVTSFKNIIQLGLRKKKEELVEDLIDHYWRYLPQSHQAYMRDYGIALLKFYQHKPKDACKILAMLKPLDIFIEIDVRILTMKCYFEMDEYEMLNDAINRFRVYINRNKHLSETHQKARLQFVMFMAKLINISPSQIKGLQKLADTIKTTTPLIEKEWLLHQVRLVADRNKVPL